MKVGKKFYALAKMVIGLALISFSFSANAQLSTWFGNVAGETGKFLLAAQFIVGVIGFLFFIYSLFEYNKQKKGQKDYTVAYSLFIVGLLLGVAAPFYLQSIKSVTNEDVEIQEEFDGF